MRYRTINSLTEKYTFQTLQLMNDFDVLSILYVENALMYGVYSQHKIVVVHCCTEKLLLVMWLGWLYMYMG